MASGSGVAGLAVTALVAAHVAAGASAFFVAARTPPAPLSPSDGDANAALRREVERLRGEVAELRSGRAAGRKPAERDPAPEGGHAPAPPVQGAAPGDVGPLPANRGELTALIDERIASRGAEAGLPGAAVPARKKVTIEEAGAEMGLSSVDIDTTRRIWRDSENEMLIAFMGTSDLDVIKEEVKAAAEDPDRKAALINKGVGNFVRNLGRIMTIEDRRDRELKKFLTEDQMKKLRGYDIKSALEDPELEDIVEKVFNNKR